MDELVLQISKDLRIYPFDSETDEEYGNRVIYCALAAWTKVQILGNSYTEIVNETEKEYPYVSQRYVNERLKNVANGLVNAIPHLKEWTEVNDIWSVKKELSNYIIEKLIFCYQINKTCKIQWLTSSPEQIVYFKNNELILGGIDWNSNLKGDCSIGLGEWRNKKQQCEPNYKKRFNIPECSLEEYYKSLEKNASWQSDELKDNYEYFSGGNGLWHSKAWKKFNKSCIPNGVSLLRRSDQKYNYISLCCYKRGEFFTAKLDEWYYREKEINRIMYVLDYYRGKPTIFEARTNGKVIELYCHSILPDAETRILLMSSWPKRTYDDIYLREIPVCIWKDIEDVLDGLGIQVVFK
ncbi:hypothetical protein [Clostridium tyrobutyricum]|uniref:hypothetical protein n=1 Tax=Clostridium tyrobutyricum TaxID=1519 RepID=UPI001C3C2E37|nr:hypothetical protein [Clostridium tyrobutyricum]MBV4436322.1 hypothetical protein [Clostridium tyrobutyricum]